MATNSLVVSETHWKTWLAHFDSCLDERMAFGFCGISVTGERVDYLLTAVDLPRDDEYRSQGPGVVSLKAEHAGHRLVRSRRYAALVDVHSHPFTAHPSPSHTDERGAIAQLRMMRDLAPGTAVVRLIVGRSGSIWAVVACRDRDWTALDEIVVTGPNGRRVVRPINAARREFASVSDRDTRTAAVIGEPGLASVRNAKVLVIGAGGIGSAVIRQLCAYVAELAIVDPDVIEQHNGPRLYHYIAGDEGEPKVTVHAREIARAFPHTRVHPVQAAFPSAETLDLLKHADLVFCCPDHNAVRWAAAQAAARYLKPLIEVGCGGAKADGRLTTLAYHVRLQVPGEPCLACSGMDLHGLEDPTSTASKRRVGYIVGADLVAGELMSLTTRAASDAVDIFFRYIARHVQYVPRHIYVDVLRWKTLDLTGQYSSGPACTLCGSGDDLIAGVGDRVEDEHCILPVTNGDAYAAM